MGVVHMRLLGGFDVAVDGTDLDIRWPTRRSAELVQLLALAPQHRLARDQCIDALWPQLDAEAGAANLRKAAHHARQALGDPEAVQLRRQQVALFPDAAISTDVEAFENAADQAIAGGDTRAAQAAIDQYGGELLPDCRYEDWAETPRGHLDALFAELLRCSGQWARLSDHDPLDEQAGAAAMRAALASGRRHEAIARYGRLRRTLLADLGVAPGEDVEDLYREAIRDLTSPGTPFVGRSPELARIDAWLANADQAGSLALIRGPAGIGKTALCDEIVTRAQNAGWRAATVTATEGAGAYSVVAAVTEQLIVGHRGLVASIGAKARAVLAALTPAVQVNTRDEPLEMALTRHQVFGAFQQLLAAAGGAGGAIVVVDEAAAADEDSLAALTHLGDRRTSPLLAVLAYRPGNTPGSLARHVGRASRTGTTLTIDLQPLARQEIETLAEPVAGPLDTGQLDRLVSRSDGNPFCVLELARDPSTLTPPNRHHSTGPTAPADAGVRQAIMSRYVDLDEHIVTGLRRLALVDGPLDLAVVLALADCDENDGTLLLDAALDAGVLVVEDGSYRFVHDLVRLTLAAQLAPHHRVVVHRRAAERLAALGARPGVVAHHWLEGRQPDRAVEWLVRAADEATQVGGYTTAVDHLDLALAQRPNHPDALRRHAQALDALGDPRALAAYAAAAKAAPAAEVHELRPLQALAQLKLGDPEGALETVAGAEPRTLESRLAQALTFSGAAALGVTDPEMGTVLAAEGRRLAFESGDPGAIVVASWAHAAAAHARGELRASVRTDLYDTQGLPRLAVSVFDGQLCITQRLLYGARPYDDVIRFADNFAAEATRLGAARGIAFATVLRGEAHLLAGHLDAAEEDLLSGCRQHRELGGATGEALGLQRLAELAHWRGHHTQAERLVDDALAVARESTIGFHLLDRIYGTRITLADDPAAALATVEEAEQAVRGPLETCPGCRITLAVPAAIASARAGDLDRAEAYGRSSQWLADVVMRLPAWYAALDEVRAHRCLAHEDITGARSHLAAAADRFAAAGHPYDQDRCKQALTALLL